MRALPTGIIDLRPLTVPVLRVERLGRLGQVHALRLGMTPELRELRTQAEESLRRAGIMWSKTWPFAPHITLARGRAPDPFAHLPQSIAFDRMEWRA